MNLGGVSIINILGAESFEILAQIHHKLLTCIAEKTVKDLQIEDQQFVIVPCIDPTAIQAPNEQTLLAFFLKMFGLLRDL